MRKSADECEDDFLEICFVDDEFFRSAAVVFDSTRKKC